MRLDQALDVNQPPTDFLPEPEPMSVQDLGDALVIRESDIFMLTDSDGQVPRGNRSGYGLYHRDTRYLSGYELYLGSTKAMTLLSTAELGYSCEQVMTNPRILDSTGQKLSRGTVHLRRSRVISDVLEERLQVANHNPFPITIDVQYRFAADFADVFEVRGYEPEHRGLLEEPALMGDSIDLGYTGTDGVTRSTSVQFEPAPDSLAGDPDIVIATYTLRLEAQESRLIRVTICLDDRKSPTEELFAVVTASHNDWLESTTRIETDNEFFNAILQRSLDDVRLLESTDDSGISFTAAGTPWFDALFGRDSAIVSMQMLAYRPEIARDSLLALARIQATKLDPWRDEEPGKIAHELRCGELTRNGELPFSPYYGSIDSTPLFLQMAAECYQWTADIELMRKLRPNIEAALGWIDQYGDTNGDGYIGYEKHSVKGLVNQGWKDSWDSMVARDGSLISPPITLVEVQGYVYSALCGLAPVFEALGDKKRAGDLRKRAATLRSQFDRDFWLADDECYALALDGSGKPAASITSNAGHALWSGIALPDKARAVARRLMSSDMFSGWGIRTLTAGSPRYNPQGYHLGTVWPHDNSLIAMGFKRYGLEPELNTLASALYSAAQRFQYDRLPELFGGHPLSEFKTPVPYPVACRPQAWAAGTIPLITQGILGLCADAPQKLLRVVNPQLPQFLERVTVRGVRVGGAEADLLYERRGTKTTVEVSDVRGELTVVTVDEWPSGSSA
ncbi:MAG: glycogen debranching N-terminal domain-containing protein [Chloroflexota bacterium]